MDLINQKLKKYVRCNVFGYISKIVFCYERSDKITQLTNKKEIFSYN